MKTSDEGRHDEEEDAMKMKKHLIIIEDDNKSWKEMRKAWILPRNTHCLLLSCSESHQITKRRTNNTGGLERHDVL